jgi:hypothetical protein
MRNGQSLGALLGYRLERRLHERSGAGLELDRFIYVLRALAPIRVGKLTDPDAAVQESLAARDVVDGLRLLDTPEAIVRQKLADGPADARYLEPGDWRPPTTAEADAVIALIAELDRTHDAVADLLLAEAVHQLVSGSPERAAAAMDALGSGESPPPEPEVVRTPRSGVPIQHRLSILVPDPPVERPTTWRTSTPRSLAEPRLDAWARDALGEPHLIPIAAGHAARLDKGRLSALDFLYDADGDSVGASTLAARLRAAIPGLPQDLGALEPVWELANLLRVAILAGRPLAPADLGRAAVDGAEGRQPDAEELIARAQAALEALSAAALAPDPLPYLVSFGVRSPPGQVADEDALIAEALQRTKTAKALLERAAGAVSASAVELAAQALTAIFGSGFVALPRLKPPPNGGTDPWAGAVGPGGVRPPPGSAQIRPWLARQGAIRKACAAFGETLLVRGALGQRPRLRVVQSPDGVFRGWVGLPFVDGEPPTVSLASMVAEVAGARPGEADPPLDGALAGLVIDEWTEVIPRRRPRADLATPDAPQDVATTGIAVNANAPGARPPQAILIALSPDGADWTGERLAAALTEVMALAQMRLVTLQTLPYAGRQLPALYFRDWSLQGEPVIDWPAAMRAATFDAAQRFLSVGA